jgi:CBS-domain-containing membrane protein
MSAVSGALILSIIATGGDPAPGKCGPMNSRETVINATDVMVRDVTAVRPDTSVVQAARLLVENDINALPVIDDEGRMVGIIGEADLMRREEIGTEKHRPWWLESRASNYVG